MRNKEIVSLNGVRGFAILLVLLSHSSNAGLKLNPVLNFSGAGRYGVFLFFVLSAFLLTGQFLEHNIDKKGLRSFLAHYFTRRFLRIYPLFGIALIIYYLLHKYGLSIYPIDGAVAIKTFFLLDAKGLFWTIPVEFQYYFLLPAVSLAIKRFTNVYSLIVCTIIFLAMWRFFIPPKYVVHVLPFVPIFFLGSVAAFMSVKLAPVVSERRGLVKAFNVFALISFLGFIVLTPFFFNGLFAVNIGKSFFHKSFLLFAVLSCCLIIFTVHGDGLIKKLMENKGLVFCGKISFSAYLGHMIILKAIVAYGKFGPETGFVVFFVLTAMLSYLTYNYIERPLSKVHVF